MLGQSGSRAASEYLRRVEAGETLEPPELGTLDAIHLASAAHFGATLRCVVTYDTRVSAAAETMGLNVAAPS